MADRVGQQIGNYQLVRLLGAGAFGEVYLGEHKYRKTQAAIKVLPQLAKDDDLQDFLNEARTVRLKHFNIVQVLDFGVERRTPFIVMEYAPNGTLRQHHPRGTRIPLLTVVSYVKQLAGALQYAHDQEIIHRDVKPENMLIGEQNQILLSDFGIATIARSTASQRDEKVVGTILYMAPEQIKAHPRPASDQYSLGVVVYEWLCDECPFSGGALQLMYQHVEVPPPPLHKKVPTILPDVEQVVMTALAKDPKQRFASVLAFATALEQASQPKMHCPASDQYFLGVLVYEWRCGERPFQGTRIEVAAISPEVEEVSADTPAQPHDLVPVPSDGASAPAPGPSSRPSNGPMVQPEPEPAQPYDLVPVPSDGASAPAPGPSSRPSNGSVVQPEPEPAQPWISRRKVVLGLGSLAGLAVLAVASGGIARWASSRGLQPPVVSGQTPTHPSPTALVSPTPTPTTAPVPPCPPFSQSHTYCGHTGEVNAMAWSPDGPRIASGSRDQKVQVWNASTGEMLLTYRGHTNWVYAVAWSPGSKYIASGSVDRTVQVWDAFTGKTLLTYKDHAGAVHALAWSPDGQRIASVSDDNTVRIWDATNGATLFSYNHSDKVHAVAWSPDGKYMASGSTDMTVQVWAWDASTNTGKKIQTYRGHTAEVDAVSWSPDSRRIVSGSLDNSAQVWDAVRGSRIFTYGGHSAGVLSVAWSPDGMHIASGSSDNTAQVWSPPMQQPIFTFSDHTNWVYAVSWSPDNKHVASASADDTVRIWEF